jgi:hypothetical protein
MRLSRAVLRRRLNGTVARRFFCFRADGPPRSSESSSYRTRSNCDRAVRRERRLLTTACSGRRCAPRLMLTVLPLWNHTIPFTPHHQLRQADASMYDQCRLLSRRLRCARRGIHPRMGEPFRRRGRDGRDDATAQQSLRTCSCRSPAPDPYCHLTQRLMPYP